MFVAEAIRGAGVSAAPSTALTAARTPGERGAHFRAQLTACPPCSTPFSTLPQPSQAALCLLSERDARVLPVSVLARAHDSSSASPRSQELLISSARGFSPGGRAPGAGVCGEDGAAGPRRERAAEARSSTSWTCTWKQEGGCVGSKIPARGAVAMDRCVRRKSQRVRAVEPPRAEAPRV